MIVRAAGEWFHVEFGLVQPAPRIYNCALTVRESYPVEDGRVHRGTTRTTTEKEGA